MNLVFERVSVLFFIRTALEKTNKGFRKIINYFMQESLHLIRGTLGVV